MDKQKIPQPKQWLLYIRKSTDEEDRQVLSLEAQLAELKEFAEKEGLEIADTFVEKMFSEGIAPSYAEANGRGKNLWAISMTTDYETLSRTPKKPKSSKRFLKSLQRANTATNQSPYASASLASKAKPENRAPIIPYAIC